MSTPNRGILSTSELILFSDCQTILTVYLYRKLNPSSSRIETALALNLSEEKLDEYIEKIDTILIKGGKINE
jgi:hypothetical protein